MARLTGGTTARIRVNPKDCQSVLDLLEHVGLQTGRMSFAQCVSLALASLLETARQQGVLPEPDPFQFSNRMAQFQAANPKFRITQDLQQMGFGTRLTAPVLAQGGSAEGFGEPAELGEPEHSVADRFSAEGGSVEVSQQELQNAKDRLSDLLELREVEETWNQSLEAEFQQVLKIVYPYG